LHWLEEEKMAVLGIDVGGSGIKGVRSIWKQEN